MSLVTWADVEGASRRIQGLVHRTPVMTSSTVDKICRGTVYFKCENLQRTGSFKLRGASNAVAQLSRTEQARGVCAPSSGNFAQALAFAAKRSGVAAHIVMPVDANPAKVRATQAYGASVHVCDPTNEAREQHVAQLQKTLGATLVHSHDDANVIAGQGTAICELIEEVGDLDVVIAPVGGGGLIAGILVAVRHLLPQACVIGCEPAGADDAARSLARGERITTFVPDTVADGLRTPLGEKPFVIMSELIDRILVVPEEAILPAMWTIWERMKLVIEPSSAVAVAPLLNGQIDVSSKRVGVILSGGNVDLNSFCPRVAS